MNVALVAVSASEPQKGGTQIENFKEFQAWLAQLGLGHLEILPAMLYWNISFWDWSLWSDDESEKLERSIHEVLFPSIEFDWAEYCRENELDPATLDRKWRNAKCDVQALWTHIHHGREIFVTADGNFHKVSKRPGLVALGARQILLPDEAAKLIARSHFAARQRLVSPRSAGPSRTAFKRPDRGR
jgi:hypothetical protein